MKSPQLRQPRPQSQSVLHLFMRLFGIGLIGITILCSVLFISVGEQALTALQALKPWLACWRLAVFSVLIGGWPYWVNRYGSCFHLTPQQQYGLIMYRWRFAILLLLIELILVQQGLAVFIRGA
jgi:hypothetical protein